MEDDESHTSSIGDEKSDRSSEGSDSLSDSSFDSQASRVAFWHDINTKDEEYKNAIIIKKQATAQIKRGQTMSPNNKQRRRRNNKDIGATIDPTRITMLKNQYRIEDRSMGGTSAHDTYTVDRINKIEKAHQIEIRNIRNLSITYAIEYFKTKSVDLNKIFTQEIFEILDQYGQLRKKMQ